MKDGVFILNWVHKKLIWGTETKQNKTTVSNCILPFLTNKSTTLRLNWSKYIQTSMVEIITWDRVYSAHLAYSCEGKLF